MLRSDKDRIIKEIMDLRSLVGDVETAENEDDIAKIQRQINHIHDLVFSL